MNNKNINKYLRMVKQIHHGKRSTKKKFVSELKDALLCFCDEHPNSTYSDIVEEFGRPSDIRNHVIF